MLLPDNHTTQPDAPVTDPGQDPAITATVAAIEAAFAGRWGVWVSDTGWWWATRTAALTADELAAGCVPHLHADNPDELTDRIRHQEHLHPAQAAGPDAAERTPPCPPHNPAPPN
jgi:hypothetical protein